MYNLTDVNVCLVSTWFNPYILTISESGIVADLSCHSIRSSSSQEDACTQTTLRRPNKNIAASSTNSSNTVGTYAMCSENVISVQSTDVNTDNMICVESEVNTDNTPQGSHLVSTNVSYVDNATNP